MKTLKRAAVFVHRWLGVALCLLFLLWFPSGIVMMYWDFPSVTSADRLQRSPALDPSQIKVPPGAVIGPGVELRQLRVNTYDGRPVYRFGGGRGGERVTFADNGQLRVVSQGMVDRAAAAWVGQPLSASRVESMDDVDQWTVQGGLRNERPLWKYSWPDGQQVYVSGASGEVVQYTTTASRIGAYFGAIPHWFYFTPLRKHQSQWSQVVIWTSGVGAATAALGIVVGLWMYLPAVRMPYVGQKRLHLILGLIFGLGAVTWAFSGMLSMDPFPAPREIGQPPALRGRVDLTAFAAKPPAAVAAEIGSGVRELELTSIDGHAAYIATLDRGDTRIVPVDGPAIRSFDTDRIVAMVKATSHAPLAEARVLAEYDRYYLDRHRLRPLPIVLVRMDDANATRYYIDPKTVRIVATYSSRRWMSRWLYHGLHSLDFPWLYAYRPAWDIVVLTFMIGGTALCVTAVILAWRVVRPGPARIRGSGGPARADI